MRNLLFVLFAMLMISCQPKSQPEITEAEVMSTIKGFFDSFDADVEQQTSLGDFVTEDFLIFENGEKMSKREFADFVSGAADQFELTDWTFSDIRLSPGLNAAHVSMLNTGRFITKGDSLKVEMNMEWLESAYLVREGEKLKIRFYFSDGIKREMDTLR